MLYKSNQTFSVCVCETVIPQKNYYRWCPRRASYLRLSKEKRKKKRKKIKMSYNTGIVVGVSLYFETGDKTSLTTAADFKPRESWKWADGGSDRCSGPEEASAMCDWWITSSFTLTPLWAILLGKRLGCHSYEGGLLRKRRGFRPGSGK